jgi:hypothetical protein
MSTPGMRCVTIVAPPGPDHSGRRGPRFLPRAGGSGVAGAGWVFCRGAEGGGAISRGCIWGEPFSPCVDHLPTPSSALMVDSAEPGGSGGTSDCN